MSPRPRTISDAAILEGTALAIGRLGIVRLTLADVAAQLRISPGTLVHRFGSKRGLLLSLLRRSAGHTEERFAALRATHPSPLGTLLHVGELLAGHVETPEVLANRLGFLQFNLTDPEFYRLTLGQARAIREEIRKLIRQAIAAGEVAPCDADKLARTVQATLNGSLLQWAIEREGKLAAWMGANLETLLRPLALGHGRRPARGRGQSRRR